MSDLVERVAKAMFDAIKEDCIRPDGSCYAVGDLGCSYDGPALEVDGEFNILPAARAAVSEALVEVERHLSAVQYDPAPYTALRHRLAQLKAESA